MKRELERIGIAREVATDRAYGVVGALALHRASSERLTPAQFASVVVGSSRHGWTVTVRHARHGSAEFRTTSWRPVAIFETMNGSFEFIECEDETGEARVNAIFAVGIADGQCEVVPMTSDLRDKLRAEVVR